ncbi:MAG: LCP family protein, partial [Candidatus Paceibacterales bacterium]
MPPQEKTPKNRIVKILALALGLFFMVFLAAKIFNFNLSLLAGPKTVVQFLTNSGLKSDNNRINILLMGIGGPGHDGPYLTDTMILASINKDGKDAVLITIPRDIWLSDQKEKINAVYANSNNNLSLTEQTISTLFGIPIHYAAVLDFSGFEKAVDLVGGLDINVDNSFTDYKYPIAGKEDDTCGIDIQTKLEGGVQNVYFKDATGSATLLTEQNDPFTCRYETLTFKAGPNHMDGVTALKFVRSRHALGPEGSDFARSARQEKVLLAFRQKVLSANTLLNPQKIIDLVSTFGKSVNTDITSDEVPLFLNLFPKVNQNTVRKISLDADLPDSRLETGDPQLYGGAFVL